jgi:diaminopimelate epimerase
MAIAFNKYQGTGNDFIIIDNRGNLFNPSGSKLIKKLCDRRFGIGADGLILISMDPEYDFRMTYFNSDGNESTMCGNGGRCSARYALSSGIAGRQMQFRTIDGIHRAIAEDGIIKLQMNDVNEFRLIGKNYFINTGSPHYVIFTDNADAVDVFNEGKKFRWSDEFKPGGTNVDFVEITGNSLYVRTFERGVEDETLSCGTGVTASAIAAVLTGHFDKSPVNVKTRGGNLTVNFNISGEHASDIWLSGPAEFVYKGEIAI